MVSAWYMDDDEVTDQRLEHHRDPPMFIETDKLFQVSGVEYYQVDPDRYKTDEGFGKLLKSRGITYEDEIVVSEDRMENYAQKLKIFYEEHLHTDEEIRYVLEGSGYFDVRDSADEWIRIKVVPGDLIILPSGIYHRFTLDDKNCIKAKRYFAGEPVWKPYNRPADNMECRLEYIERSNQGFVQN